MKVSKFLKIAAVSLVAVATLGCDDNNTTQPVTNTQTGGPVAAPAAVYTMSNDAASNGVREYRRSTDGTLSFVREYATGASGSGDGLSGASGGLNFDPSTNRFYAVNAGSNSITLMSLGLDGTLLPISTINSGGTRPISVTFFGDTVYVLNAGNAGSNIPANISGFQVIAGQLVAIPNSTQPLSAANPNPAQIAFHPSGTVLVVTERATNNITTYPMSNNVAGTPVVTASNGTTPFGFDFTPTGALIVSNATSGNAGASTASSYLVSLGGVVATVTNALATNQTAACWVEAARNGQFAYVTNTGTNNVTILNVDANGNLSLQGNGSNASTGANPIDLEISDDNLFLYVLNAGDDSISAYGIAADGSLSTITGATGLPVNSVGLVAR